MKLRNVLFLCNHNSARSQIAEALLSALADDRFTAFSAGLDPRPVSPLAVEAMGEIGIDLSSCESKSTKLFLGKVAIHHAIFLCARSEDECPKIYPFAGESLYWVIPAPATLAEERETNIEAYREVREILDRKIRQWPSERASC